MGTRSDLRKYLPTPTDNLMKFEAIYIPDIRDSTRQSDMPRNRLEPTEKNLVHLQASSKRKSEKFVEEKKKNVKIYEEEEIKETDYPSE